MERTVMVGGKELKMRASALIPRLYRYKFRRDMVADMRQLQRAYAKASTLPEDATDAEREDAQFSVADLTIFEDVAYIMAKHGGNEMPDTPEAWLDTIDGVFSIYEILPVILELWGANTETTSIPKKK